MLVPNSRSQDDEAHSSHYYEGGGWCRRRVLSASTVTVLTSLSGCLSFLNPTGQDSSTERETGTSPSRETGRNKISDPRGSEEVPEFEPESGNTFGSSETTPGDEIVGGPVDSPLTNEHPWIDDPEDDLRLADVTVHMGSEWVRDYLIAEDDTLALSVDGDRFIVEGNAHLEWECDVFRLKHVFVDGRVGKIYLEPVENDACRTNENKDGFGPWLAPFTVTGRFDSGRPDALEVHLEGEFIEGDGPRGGAYTRQYL